jgi:hypothetical protein
VCLVDAHVADVDADADGRHVNDLLGETGEPVRGMPCRVLQKDHGTALADVVSELSDRRLQLVGPLDHRWRVVHHDAGDPASEVLDERGDPVTIVGHEQIEAAVEVHRRQDRPGGRERQHPVELGKIGGVDLRPEPHLVEAQPRQPQQRIVARHALREQPPDLPHQRLLATPRVVSR